MDRLENGLVWVPCSRKEDDEKEIEDKGIKQLKNVLQGQKLMTTTLTKEIERLRKALEELRELGKYCSGDVYEVASQALKEE